MSDSGFKGPYFKKRKSYKNVSENEANNPEEDSPIVKLFRGYQVELDAKYDKYERLVKKSRDLTIESKRIIFLLHRITSDRNKDEILEEAESRLNTLFVEVISGIAKELTNPEVFQYVRSFSPGLQEFVEAMSFYHYLKHGSLVNIEDIWNPNFILEAPDISAETTVEIQSNGTQPLPLSALLTPTDFVLGIADLTGELMRKCINSVGSGNIDEPFRLCYLLQNIYDGFLVNGNYSVKELRRKIYTLKSSLQKVENACYAIRIRGTEMPKHMLADFFSTEYEYNDSVECEG